MEAYASPWKALASRWEKYYTPPGRPSADDLRTYRDFILAAIKKRRNPAALVLGSTPELRNLLHSHHLPVTIIDVNWEMICAMNESVPHRDSETIVKSTWASNPLADNSFDVIVGDLTWPNVPREQWQQFHKTISRLLKKSGAYIQRINVIPDGWMFDSTAEVFDRFSRLPHSPQRHFELFFHLLNNSFDSRTHTVSTKTVNRNIAPFWRNGRWIAKKKNPQVARLLKRLWAFWGDGNKEWSTDTAKNLKKYLMPHFTFVDERISRDYLYAEGNPLWYYKKS